MLEHKEFKQLLLGRCLPPMRTLQDLCLDFKGTVPQEDEEFDEEFWKSLEEVARIYGFQILCMWKFMRT